MSPAPGPGPADHAEHQPARRLGTRDVALMIVGIVIGALQSATQINEPAVAFVPKLLAVMLVMAVTGASTLGIFVDYVREMIIRIPQIAG